jgi:hypothetical protein
VTNVVFSAFRQGLALALFPVLWATVGCQRSLPTDLPTHAAVASGTVPTSILHVQSLALYQQAELACRQKQFREAAHILDQLAASPGLSSDEIAYCNQQRDLCLRDAGDKLALTPASLTAAPRPPSAADCGPRALALICERMAIHTSLARLNQLANATSQGTSMEGLANAAHALGLKAEGVQVSREALAHVESPAIAWINQTHFVAVLSVQGEGEEATATIHDPNSASAETIPQERLLRLSSGYLLLIHR